MLGLNFEPALAVLDCGHTVKLAFKHSFKALNIVVPISQLLSFLFEAPLNLASNKFLT